MAIFASTTTSGYSDPYKALSIKALEQRQKDMQAQMAAQQPDAAMMATIPGGIGHVLGQVGDSLREGRAASALAAQKDELARTIAGIAQNNGQMTPEQQATLARVAPEVMKEYQERQQTRELADAADRRARELATQQQAHTSTESSLTRQQQKELAEAADQRARDLATQQQTATATEGGLTRQQQKELAEAGDKRARELQQERLAAEAALEEKRLATAAATAAADPKKAEAVSAMEQQLTQKDLMVNELTRAEEALKGGINMGVSGQIATNIAKLPGGGYLTDKEQAQRTELFDTTMNKVATGAMSTILKGQSTDYEMKKFIAMYNNPNISMEAKRAAFGDVLAAARKDREIEARAVKKVGGDTSPVTAAPAAADPMEGRTATGPNGQQVIRRNGKWEPK